MIVFFNGRFLPEEHARLSVFDRGFLYGDGLFETVLIRNRRPFRWADHWGRLAQGAEVLRLPLPFGSDQLQEAIPQLLDMNQLPQALLRLSVSRGTGPRGYSPKNAGPPTVVMNLHPWSFEPGATPPQWRLHTASFRLPEGSGLASIKSASKLYSVLARQQADAAGADEALLLNTAGHLAEAASSNLFWIRGNRIQTPPLAAGVLNGITRQLVLQLGREQGLAMDETVADYETLHAADGVFVTLTSYGIVEAIELDGKPLTRSRWAGVLFRAFWERVRLETSGPKTPCQ